jgi:hypothetical protein
MLQLAFNSASPQLQFPFGLNKEALPWRRPQRTQTLLVIQKLSHQAKLKRRTGRQQANRHQYSVARFMTLLFMTFFLS